MTEINRDPNRVLSMILDMRKIYTEYHDQVFHRIRMSEDSEKLTTFLTRFGAFKYVVMPFGLCHRPASWQHLINDTLFDFLHRFV